MLTFDMWTYDHVDVWSSGHVLMYVWSDTNKKIWTHFDVKIRNGAPQQQKQQQQQQQQQSAVAESKQDTPLLGPNQTNEGAPATASATTPAAASAPAAAAPRVGGQALTKPHWNIIWMHEFSDTNHYLLLSDRHAFYDVRLRRSENNNWSAALKITLHSFTECYRLSHGAESFIHSFEKKMPWI